MGKMEELDKKIIDCLMSADPPQKPSELSERLQTNVAYLYSRIQTLLRRGLLSPTDLPWRSQPVAPKHGRPRKRDNPLAESITKLRQIIDENGRDRVAAIGKLIEATSMATDVLGPPPPDDDDGQVKYLSYIMGAIGKTLTLKAYRKAFPPHGIMQTKDQIEEEIFAEVEEEQPDDMGEAAPG